MTKRKSNEPTISPDQADELQKLFRSGATLNEVGEHFGCSIATVVKFADRYGVERCRGAGGDNRKRRPGRPRANTNHERAKQHRVDHRDEAWRHRITDYPASLTASIFGDPTPMRLRMVHGDRLSDFQ